MVGRRLIACSWLALSLLALPAWLPAVRAERTAAPAPTLHDLGGLPDLRSLFDREADQVRVVMLLSPT